VRATQPMNVAFVCADPAVPVFGSKSSSVHVQEMTRAMLKRGFEVDLFAANFGGAAPSDLAGAVLHSIAPQARQRRPEQERALLANNAAIRDLLYRSDRERNYTFVYERYSLWNFAGMEFAREKNIPGVLEVNAPLLEENARRHLLIDRAGAEDAKMRAFRSATVITPVSRELAHIVEKHPSARGKVRVVSNGANAERFAFAPPMLHREPDTFIVGFVGEIAASQGLSNLVNAFQLVADALPHARLVIAGAGEEREALERDIAARELTKHVKLLGAVAPEEVPGLLASFDAAVAPYPQITGFYGSPLKVFEYMAAGLPVVASRIGQLAEIIRDGQTGVLVPPGDREALAQALYDLGENPEQRHQLGDAARATAHMAHTWDGAFGHILAHAGIRPAVALASH
jgi:glycosyltransferase involved in cell wall biosynthesis